MLRVLAWMVLLCGFGEPALACSLALPKSHPFLEKGFYIPPTALKMAEKADLVVLGTVVDYSTQRGRSGRPWVDSGTPALRPIQVLKGPNFKATLRLTGLSAIVPALPAGPPQINPLWMPPVDIFYGACNRQRFLKDQLVIGFFSLTPTGYQLLNAPFANVAVDAVGHNGLWVRAASFYVRVTALPKGPLREAALRRERERLLVQKDPDSRYLAADIGYELGLKSEVERRGTQGDFLGTWEPAF